MERSGYWRIYGKCWRNGQQGWRHKPIEHNGVFESAPPVYYGGKLLPLELYLAVPTFQRLGRRPAI